LDHKDSFLIHPEGIDLKQVVVRGIPEQIARTIKREAERKGLSLNKAFLSILEKATGLKGAEKRKKALYHDLDRLSGIWTKAEADQFEQNLEFQRGIDETLWKKTE
jgi:hypothetical protein